LRVKDFLNDNGDVAPLDMMAIVAHVLEGGKEEVFRNPERELTEEVLLQLKRLVAERRQGRPLAYITGMKEFFSDSFRVDERVLIPRPETELLVEEALRILEKKTDISYIMDMGTGSGAIGISLAKRLSARVFAVDLSAQAICVAAQNSRRLEVEEKISFLCSDLFSGIRDDIAFDVIVANLPYVPTKEWSRTMVDVRAYEPRLALDGGEDGLDVYRRFISGAARRLKRSGRVLCEIDGPIQADQMKQMLESEGFEVLLRKDLAGRERIVEGLWISS
jgi:release factor glutamine methyltransferase